MLFNNTHKKSRAVHIRGPTIEMYGGLRDRGQVDIIRYHPSNLGTIAWCLYPVDIWQPWCISEGGVNGSCTYMEVPDWKTVKGVSCTGDHEIHLKSVVA